MSRAALLSFSLGPMLLVLLAGCQSNRPVIPPPGSLMSQSDAYYNRPAGAATSPAAGAPVNLSPNTLPNLPAPPVTSGASNMIRVPRDTYDVATRVAADGQPIRVLDSTTGPANYANVPRGMTLNDGTTVRGWQTGAGLPASVASNPFNQLRGTSGALGSLPQGYSAQDGQWRSRSSYESVDR